MPCDFLLTSDSDVLILLFRYKIFGKALKRIQDDSQVSEINLDLLAHLNTPG